MKRKENLNPQQRAPLVSRKLLGKKKVDTLQKARPHFIKRRREKG